MKYIILLLFLIVQMPSGLYARQQLIALSDLMEMGKWPPQKVERFVKSKGFSYGPLDPIPNELVPIYRNFGDTIMAGEHTAPAIDEGDAPIKRSVLYCKSYAVHDNENSVYLRYYTSDPAEFEAMKEDLQSKPEFLYDASNGVYSDGQYEFELEDARIKLNTMGRGGFVRRYMFRMKTPKKYAQSTYSFLLL